MADEEQGMAVRNQIYSCNSGKLVSEEVEHRKYGVEANFFDEGIRLTQLSKYFIQNGTLMIPNKEIDPLLSIFNLWEKHHNSLPGSKSYGHSFCGWISTDYFAAGSDEPEFYTSKSNRREKQVEKFKKDRIKAEKDLDERLKSKLSTKTLEAKISRFELELKYKDSDTTGLLTENDIAAFRDFVPLYRKRRKNYE